MLAFQKYDGGRPADKRGPDCAVRALATATNEAYDEVRWRLALALKKPSRKRMDHDGIPTRAVHAYLVRRGWSYFPPAHALPRRGPAILLVKFQDKGSLHVAAVVDSVIYDTFDWRKRAVQSCGFYAPRRRRQHRFTRIDNYIW